MKGDKQIIDALNDCLMAELTGIKIYYIHYDAGRLGLQKNSLAFKR